MEKLAGITAVKIKNGKFWKKKKAGSFDELPAVRIPYFSKQEIIS
jgi:hypothetical protein